MTTANDLKSALYHLGMKGTAVKGTTVNKALASRISRARQQLAAKGVSSAKIDYLVKVFGDELAASILDDLAMKGAKEADGLLTHYKDYPSATVLKARVLDFKRVTAELESSRKTTVSVTVTPDQLEALALQVGLDPNSAFYGYLTRRYIDQLYNMLIDAGASLDITTKAADPLAAFFGFKQRISPDNHTPFWPIQSTKQGKP